MASTAPILVIDRRTGVPFAEKVLGGCLVRWAYGSPAWRPLHPLLFGRAWLSRLLGWYANRSFSRWRVPPVVRDLEIDLTDFVVPPGGYRSFNAFFIRSLLPGARTCAPAPDAVVAPADCRLFVYPALARDSCVPVKGIPFTVAELLGPRGASAADAAGAFSGGVLMVARLCPADYHRFHFPCDGEIVTRWHVAGRYDSVNPFPLAQGIRAFAQNRREVTLLRNPRLGLVAYVEVGAFGVGSICQTHSGAAFRRMDEKGFFAFGGSTVVLVFEAGRLQPDADLVAHSASGLETRVQVGERVGRTLIA